MPKITKLLLILITCLAFNIYADGGGLEMIVVNKIWADGTYGVGWYEIGLSRNGKEPVEIIWITADGPNSHSIARAKIGDKGIVSISDLGEFEEVKLPKPNAKNPPIIGVFEEVWWQPIR